MDWPTFFWYVLKAALFSTGGFGPLPSLHADLLARGWATEKQFTAALAVGQLSPGPNGLWVVSLSYLVAGLPGAILATLALMIPPLFILLVERGYLKIATLPATQGLLDGVVLVIVGIGVTILTDLLRSTDLDASILVIVTISAFVALSRRMPVNGILLAAAAAGLLLYWRG